MGFRVAATARCSLLASVVMPTPCRRGNPREVQSAQRFQRVPLAHYSEGRGYGEQELQLETCGEARVLMWLGSRDEKLDSESFGPVDLMRI